MTENTKALRRKRNRHYTEEAKKRFYELWKSSGMKIGAFCESHDLTKSVFYGWRQCFGDPGVSPPTPELGSFVSVRVAKEAPIHTGSAQVKLILPNQIELHVTLDVSGLVSFLQELCHATAIIR